MVGQVGNVSESEAEDGLRTVCDGDRLELQAEDFERRFVDQIHVELRYRSVSLRAVENVGKHAFDGGKRRPRYIDRNARSAVEVERADIVEAEDMVRVRMRIYDGVEPRSAGAEYLRAKVGGGVDDDIPIAVTDKNGRPQAGIPRIRRAAYRARAADGGHAGTGSRAQHRDLQAHLRSRWLLAGLDEAKTQFGKGVVERPLFFHGQIAFGLLLQHREQIDVVPGHDEVGTLLFRFLSLTLSAEPQHSEAQLGLQTKRIHQKIESGRRQFRWFFFIHNSPVYNREMNAGEKFQRLVEIMARLRAPGGCPWDREQTFDSIKPYSLEETYEVLDAIDRRDWDELRGELGDFMLQAVFFAQMAAEEKLFDIGDTLDAINEKLIRRHPHVFSGETAETGDDVRKIWDTVKNEERKNKTGMLASVPRNLPALVEAQQISSRAARAGFDWSDIGGVLAKLDEELSEFAEARERGSQEQIEDELGDLFFVLVNIARFLKVDPEQALRRTNLKFRQRFAHVERRLAAQGKEMPGVPIDELEGLWQEAKSSS